MVRHSVTRATSTVARLRRHGRTPTDEEILDAYRELVAAKIEQCIGEADERGLPLDPARSLYLQELLSSRTEGSLEATA